MSDNTEKTRKPMSCDTCKLRKVALNSPKSLLGRFWIWHTTLCPGWKKYVKTCWEHGEEPPQVGNTRGFWADRSAK